MLAVVLWPSPAAAGPPAGHTYQPPVEAPVIDPFRLPPEPWMAGNRGIEYATVAGSPVGAIGPGVVVFAGPVAGARHVTVRHPDGLRSSYSFLATIQVAVGQGVTTGQPVGRAGDRFHVGVRRGDAYLDPASLWGTPVGGGRVVLVPLDGRGAGSAGASADAPVRSSPAADEPGPGDRRSARRSLVDAGVELSATAATVGSTARGVLGALGAPTGGATRGPP